MKLLLDCCIARRAVAPLEASGHDVVHVGDFPEDPGDLSLMKLAYLERRVIVTLDKDFPRLAILHEIAHCGIVRLVQIPGELQGQRIDQTLRRYAREIGRAFVITVEPTRDRLRPSRVYRRT